MIKYRKELETAYDRVGKREMAKMDKEAKTLQELSAEDCQPGTEVEQLDEARRLWARVPLMLDAALYDGAELNAFITDLMKSVATPEERKAIEDEIERKAEEETKRKAEEEAKHDEELAKMLTEKGWAVGKQDHTGPSASSLEVVESQSKAPVNRKKGAGGRPKGSVGLKNRQFLNVEENQIDAVLEALVFSKPVPWERFIGKEERKALQGAGRRSAEKMPIDAMVFRGFPNPTFADLRMNHIECVIVDPPYDDDQFYATPYPIDFLRELKTIRKVRPPKPDGFASVGIAKGCKVLWFGSLVNLGHLLHELKNPWHKTQALQGWDWEKSPVLLGKTHFDSRTSNSHKVVHDSFIVFTYTGQLGQAKPSGGGQIAVKQERLKYNSAEMQTNRGRLYPLIIILGRYLINHLTLSLRDRRPVATCWVSSC